MAVASDLAASGGSTTERSRFSGARPGYGIPSRSSRASVAVLYWPLSGYYLSVGLVCHIVKRSVTRMSPFAVSSPLL